MIPRHDIAAYPGIPNGAVWNSMTLVVKLTCICNFLIQITLVARIGKMRRDPSRTLFIEAIVLMALL